MVVEQEGHCISVFSPSGEKLGSFGMHGSHQGQFDHPVGVALDSEGNILVSDNGNKRIQKFTAKGKFLRSVGKVCGFADLWNSCRDDKVCH